MLDLNKLEALAKAATHGKWFVNDCCDNKKFYAIKTSGVFIGETLGCYNGKANAAYIAAACNSLPALIDELKEARAEKGELKRHSEWLERKLQLRIDNNAALIQWVQELEKALIELVKMEAPLPECAVCWDRDECTDHAHGDDCLAIRHIIDVAKEAAKETRNE